MTPIINIKKGDAPVAHAVILAAKEPTMTARGWPNEIRQAVTIDMMLNPTSDRATAAATALTKFEDDLRHTITINTFNAQLAAYRKAIARLSHYRLADGQPEIMEMMPTGETDEDGYEVTENTITQVGIDPLDPEIQQDIRDPETGEVTDVEWVPNPEIVKDDEERAAAQAVIDATPQEVIDYVAADS